MRYSWRHPQNRRLTPSRSPTSRGASAPDEGPQGPSPRDPVALRPRVEEDDTKLLPPRQGGRRRTDWQSDLPRGESVHCPAVEGREGEVIAMAMRCPSCQAPLSDGAGFCLVCGAATSPSSRPDQPAVSVPTCVS